MPRPKKDVKPPLRLYHGTSEIIAKEACRTGLSLYDLSPFDEFSFPRTIRSSTKEAACLTTVYPGLLAANATEPRERWGIIEVDPSRLEDGNFAPHEWFLLENSKVKISTEEERIKQFSHFRQDSKSGKKWKESLDECGFCLYKDKIPLHAITKVVIYDPNSNLHVTKAISIVNPGFRTHKSNLQRHSMLTRWLMCEHIAGPEWAGEIFSKIQFAEQSRITTVLQNKSGLDIYHSYVPSKKTLNWEQS
jgi:hypothetical protein